MKCNATLNSKLIDGDLLINTGSEVLFYSAGSDDNVYYYGVYHGTEEEFIKEIGLDVSEWQIVSTANPYGSYEQQCREHALGIIDMDAF